jgi:hypothetical protein
MNAHVSLYGEHIGQLYWRANLVLKSKQGGGYGGGFP